MRILVYGINYYPELIGVGKYTAEMCEWLAEQDHAVEVITAMPSYPSWEIMKPYRNRLWHTEIIKGVRVNRCPLYVPGKVNGRSRIIHELSFAVSSLWYWLFFLFKKFDAVICVAPPLQTGLAGVVYKFFHKSLFIYHVQDLQLDAAKQLGLIKNKTLLSAIFHVEKFILSKSDYVSTISDGMKRKILLKGVHAEKIISLNNWIDTRLITPQERDNEIMDLFGINEEKLIVLYSGNIGEKQGLEMLIPVAEWLKNENIVFLVIGDGGYKKKFQELIRQKNIGNIRMFPLQPIQLFIKILNVADIHLVLQKKAAEDLVMPSKLAAILSVGGVAIVTANQGSTLHDIICDNELGIVIEPENPEALREAIVATLKGDPSKLQANARNYAKANLEREVILNNFQLFLRTHSIR